ncbi:hypothetical protein EXIGLDRAFT_752556 [Exidia glandulosa HHB12029]|uniref:F-box domain-containing protein n=1 Tax=Exidia glandulosa HHB12029 TaxID=1314781 RepID=A0A165ZYQ9_EXIGL|nr:hypothetical protein EXIGLDRAFT_752556 [Exidia glandulosa HHB12029]
MSGAVHKQIYGLVVEIMREIMRELSSASDVKAAARAIRCVVDQALPDAKQSWNTSTVWTIAHFPPELLAQIFSWLDIAGRARVTEVCRDWRAVALGDPSLWTQIKLRNDEDMHCFDSLLRRAGTLFLALDLDYQDPDAVAPIIADNISRISSLTLRGICPTGLFHGPSATQLREFEYRNEVISIPRSSWAPNLQHLSLSGFRVPLLGNDRPFRHLTHFYGSLLNSDARRTPGLYAPSLVILEFIKCRSRPFDWRKDLPQFHAPNLRELVVAFRVGEKPSYVLQLVKGLRVLLRDTLGLPTGSISRLTLRNFLAQDGDIAVLSQIAQEVIMTDDPDDSIHSTSP